MEPDRADYYIISPSERSQRAQSTRSSRSIKWDIMDLADRSTLEGFAPAISAIPDLP